MRLSVPPKVAKTYTAVSALLEYPSLTILREKETFKLAMETRFTAPGGRVIPYHLKI